MRLHFRKFLKIIFTLVPCFVIPSDYAYSETLRVDNHFVADLKFLGISVKPYRGSYIVLKDVNVRAKPLTKSRRLGRLKSGIRVEATGRVKGPWLLVRTSGGMKGFVFEPILMPVIDGTLAKPIKGDIAIDDGRSCDYTIEFLGKTQAKGLSFEFADFEISWRCKKGGKIIEFNTPMFLSEGPHQGTRKPVHQITIDIMEHESGLEEVFSTHLLWDREKGDVQFDSVNIKKYIFTRKLESRAADSIATAFNSAVYLSASSWASGVWSALGKKSKKR
ncbi:MAG: hypothetical protein CMF69_03615 [Magnetovibrio sp.]|nr:hypothetical protein [Magnetovibrio sp.]